MPELNTELARLNEIVGTVDVPFQKKSLDVQDNGTLILKGILATTGEDRKGEQFDGPTLREQFKQYFDRHPVVCVEHRLTQVIGYLTDYTFKSNGDLEVTAEIPKPPESESGLMATYERIKSGVMRAFSIGGRWKRMPGVNKVWPTEILEASVAGLPVDPNTFFEVIGTKSLGSLDDELESLAALRTDPLDREVDALKGLL
jgi:hypothetical protein